MSNPVVLAYGTLCLDGIWLMDRLPEPGTYEEARTAIRSAGGEAVNTAAHLAAWGHGVRLAGTVVGHDDEGDELIRRLEADLPGVETSHIQRGADARTPYCLCLATPDGHRTMLGYGFDEMQCTPVSDAMLEGAACVVLDGNAPAAAVAAGDEARRRGIPVVAMDLAGVRGISADVHLASAERLGCARDRPTAAAAAATLAHETGATCIVTMGELGCVAAGNTGLIHYRAVGPATVVDSTGAGDAFRAGIVHGLLCGWDLDASVRLASAAGALNCAAAGGWGGAGPLDEVLRSAAATPELRLA